MALQPGFTSGHTALRFITRDRRSPRTRYARRMLVTVLTTIGLLGLPASHALAGWRRRTADLFALGTLDLFLAVLVLASRDEHLWSDWMREDAWIEWGTAHAFLAAAAVFGWRALRGQGWGRLAGVGLAAFCFFVAGEELSWGQRIFAFQPPEIFLEANYQQEANLHNLLTRKELYGFSLDSRFLVAVFAVLYGIVGGVIGLAGGRFRLLRELSPPLVLAPFFALVASVELEYPIDLAGEAAECSLGLILLADALLRDSSPGRPRATWLALLPGVIALGAATAPALEAVLYGSDDARIAQTRDELDVLAKDMATATQEKLVKKGRVHKRVYTATVSEYLRFGTDSAYLEGQPTPAEVESGGRADRKGYFLDPWNNPYWVLWDDDDDGILIVYSFGPNRRRDTEMRPFTEPEGDDIVHRVHPTVLER